MPLVVVHMLGQGHFALFGEVVYEPGFLSDGLSFQPRRFLEGRRLVRIAGHATNDARRIAVLDVPGVGLPVDFIAFLVGDGATLGGLDYPAFIFLPS